MPKKRKPIRRIAPWERLPMYHAGEVGGDKEVAIIETPEGAFEIETRDHRYPLDAEEPDIHIEADKVFIINKAIAPSEIKRISSLEEAGIRGGIHSKHTWLVALHDGSLWIAKQTGTEERDEIFVYLLAQKMFRGVVPETVPGYIPKIGWVSMQRKVAGIPAGRVDGLHGYFHGNEEMQADLIAMLVLDYLTGNPDRHSNNWFVMHNDRLAAIDNGWAGEDPTMTLSAVFQPADLAGLVRDESLWPKMLQMMLTLVNDLTGRGDEARALAQEIAIDRKEAVLMVRLWEPKLQRLARFIQSEASKLQKEKVYIEPGEQPPLGTRVEEGPRGGHYYESEGIPAGMEEEEREQGTFKARPLTQELLEEAKKFNDNIFGQWLDDYSTAHGNAAEHTLRGVIKDDIVKYISEDTGIDYPTVNAYIKAWTGSATQSVESLAMQNAAAEMFGLKKNAYIEEQAQHRQATGDVVERLEMQSKAIVKSMYEETQRWLKERGVSRLILFRGMRWAEYDTPAEMRGSGAGKDIEFHSNPLSSWSSNPEIAEEFANYNAEGVESESDYEDAFYLNCLSEAEAAAKEIQLAHAMNQAEEDEEEFDEEEFENTFDMNYDPEADTDCEPPSVPTPHVRAFAVAEVPADRIISLSATGLGSLNEREVVVAGDEHEMRVYSEYSTEEGGLSLHNFVEESAPKPLTALEQQKAQQKEWFNSNIDPLFDKLTQQQADLRRDYEKRIEAADTQKESTRLGDAYRELYNEMQADATVAGKKLIEAAGYMPEGGWATAVDAPMSPELRAWREEHYAEWVEENMADDAGAWIDRMNALGEKKQAGQKRVYEVLGRALNKPDVDAEKANKDSEYAIRVLEATYQNAKLGNDVAYFRAGAKKIRDAGFEPKGRFALQEADDAKAGK